MPRALHQIPMWGLPLGIIGGIAVCATLAAVALDKLMYRPEAAGSVTTMLPGFVYALATVMKVCLITGLVSAVIVLARRRFREPAPVFAAMSLLWTPLTPLLGAMAVVLMQAVMAKSAGVSISYFPQVARWGVFVLLALFGAGVLAALAGLMQRERPRVFPVLGLVTNAALIALCIRFRFYALGFDQDRWAP